MEPTDTYRQQQLRQARLFLTAAVAVAYSRQTGAPMLCCHPTGKDATCNYRRGASARLAAAAGDAAGPPDDDPALPDNRARRNFLSFLISLGACRENAYLSLQQ